MTFRGTIAVALFTSACYSGSAHSADLGTLSRDADWVRVDVPVVRQNRVSDCGPAALAAVLAYWGQPATLSRLERELPRRAQTVTTAGELETFARSRGLVAYALFAELSDVTRELSEGRPVIVGLAKPYTAGKARAHFEVLVGFHARQKRVLLVDPAAGLREDSLAGFLTEWLPTGRVAVLVSSPS